MPRALVDTGMELEYETFGSPSDPALLLIMGYTAQLTNWDERLCQLFADGGRFVIRFDNRDCGLSTKLDGQMVDLEAVMVAAFSDEELPAVPYTLSDMAADAMGLLDHLGIERAHVMGESMGGMIAQTVAIEHPHRVRSLISVMSQPGDPEVGQPTDAAAAAIFAPSPTDRQGYIDSSPQWMVWQSQKYGDETLVRDRAARSFDRSFYPEGGQRQMAAIFGSGRRSEALSKLDVPTLVIHGRDDQLITPSGGFRTAELIPGAHLLFVRTWATTCPNRCGHSSSTRCSATHRVRSRSRGRPLDGCGGSSVH